MVKMIAKRLTAIMLAVMLSVTLIPFSKDFRESSHAVYAESAGFTFESSAAEFDISDYDGYLYVSGDEGVETWTSSNESVVEITSHGSYSVYFDLKSVGTSVITATGYDGSVDTCTVTVVAPELVIPNQNITCSVSDESLYFDITSGYGLSFKSSDTSVLQIDEDSYDARCYMDLIAPGKATITVTDCAGKTETVSVAVGEAEWLLETTSISEYISESAGYLEIETDDWNNEFIWKSSNDKVVSIESYGSGYYCELDYKGVGTAIITVTDKYGKEATCTVTIKADPLVLNCSTLKFDSYYEDDEDWIYVNGSGENEIASVKSSNTKVVTAKKEYDEEYCVVIPVGAGVATITVTDQYGQKKTVSVTVTQKYIDESKYLGELQESYAYNIIYGETTIESWCGIAANVYTTVKGKKYTGYVNQYGEYIIKGIPKLAAGSKITVVFQKGQAKYTDTITVNKKQGAYLKGSAKAQVYSGKALKPVVTIKDGKTTLKKGTDYTVKYSNNRKVGKGKATITFKGNYKGAKAVYFKINPKSTAISKVSAVKKGFNVKWKKRTTQTTGYQIQYSTNKNFKSGNKTVTVNKNKTTSKKINKLKAKKKYYVRVRTYKIVGKTKYYSSWSSAKAVVTKR